jgi:MoxR-like ATPase
MGDRTTEVQSPAALAECLDAGYLPHAGLATAALLAVRMGRPPFFEGEAGTGKTALAQALVTVFRGASERLRGMAMTGTDGIGTVVGFAGTVRSAGVDVTFERVQAMVGALDSGSRHA